MWVVLHNSISCENFMRVRLDEVSSHFHKYAGVFPIFLQEISNFISSLNFLKELTFIFL